MVRIKSLWHISRETNQLQDIVPQTYLTTSTTGKFESLIFFHLVIAASVSEWKSKKEAGLLSEEVTKEMEEDDIYAVTQDSEVNSIARETGLLTINM